MNEFKYENCPICNSELDKCKYDVKEGSMISMYKARRKDSLLCLNNCYSYLPITVTGQTYYFIRVFEREFNFSPYDEVEEREKNIKGIYSLIRHWRKNERYLTELMK